MVFSIDNSRSTYELIDKTCTNSSEKKSKYAAREVWAHIISSFHEESLAFESYKERQSQYLIV